MKQRVTFTLYIIALLFSACITKPISLTPTASEDSVEIENNTVTPESTISETLTPTTTPEIVETIISTRTPTYNEQGLEIIADRQGHVMVKLPAGTFTMGITEEQAQYLISLSSHTAQSKSENQAIWLAVPAHEVVIPYDYWMDVYEVTNEQYEFCIQQGFCEESMYSNFPQVIKYLENPRHPVLYLDWHQANAYCEWRDARLPTEEEWEYAARGVDGRLWPWGNTQPTLDMLLYVSDEDFMVLDPSPVEVGSYSADMSPFGVYDMAGNVVEFVAGRFEEYPSSAVTPQVASQSRGIYVGRGGNSTALLPNTSVVVRQIFQGVGQGFRCVRDVDTNN